MKPVEAKNALKNGVKKNRPLGMILVRFRLKKNRRAPRP